MEIDRARQAVAANPQDDRAYYNLGLALAEQQQWQDAIAAYQTTVELNPESWEAYHHWGDALINLERWDEAVGAYQRAIALNPNVPWTHHNLGLALLKLELYSEAVPFFRHAIELNPKFAPAHFHLAETLGKQKLWDLAIAAYQTTEQLNPEFPRLQQQLAKVLQQRADSDRAAALNCYRQALASALSQANLFPGEIAQIYLEIGTILAQQQRFEEALFYCHHARQLQPKAELDTVEPLYQQLLTIRSKFYQPPANLAIADHSYALWCKYHIPQPEDLQQIWELVTELVFQPVISLILPLKRFERSSLQNTIASLLTQVYPYWELYIVGDESFTDKINAWLARYPAAQDSRINWQWCEVESKMANRANLALTQAQGEFIALLEAGIILSPDALAELALQLNQNLTSDLIYSDEDRLNQSQTISTPWFKPDWCPDLLLCRNYFGSFVVYRRSLVETVGGWEENYQQEFNYDLILRVTEITANITHIPRVLAHCPQSLLKVKPEITQRAIAEALQRRGETGTVTANPEFPQLHTIRYQIKKLSLVSIIILTKNLGEVLDECLESIFSLSTYPNYEVLVIDNGSDREETLQAIANWQQRQPGKFRSLRVEQPFNYSRLNNYAVSQCEGEYLLFLNNDTKVITPDWIEGMVEQAQRPSIGAVGALLLYPDNTIQHAGVILGVTGVAGHGHRHFHINEPGYNHLIHSTHNYAAVTAACMMCRREVFQQVRGFEPQLAVAYNDVDFCLKLKQQGYHNIFLPHVRLYHYESLSRSQEETPEQQARIKQEVTYMEQKWANLMARDPSYSIHLTKAIEDYSLNLNPQTDAIAVWLKEPQTEPLLGYFIDEPKPGKLIQEELKLIGWAIGKQSRAIALEIINQEKIIATTKINQPRPDVAQVYPESDGAIESGFSTTLKLAELPHNAQLNLRVVLADRTSVKLAKVLLRN